MHTKLCSNFHFGKCLSKNHKLREVGIFHSASFVHLIFVFYFFNLSLLSTLFSLTMAICIRCVVLAYPLPRRVTLRWEIDANSSTTHSESQKGGNIAANERRCHIIQRIIVFNSQYRHDTKVQPCFTLYSTRFWNKKPALGEAAFLPLSVRVPCKRCGKGERKKIKRRSGTEETVSFFLLRVF